MQKCVSLFLYCVEYFAVLLFVMLERLNSLKGLKDFP